MVGQQWVSLPLGCVITLQRGFDLPSRLRQGGDVPIVSSSGISGHHNHAPVEAPGVVTGRYGTIGVVFYIQDDFWPLNTTLYVSDFKGNDPIFTSFLLKTIDFKSYSGKSGVPGVNRNDLHEILVYLPPFQEQQAIAKALSDVDDLIDGLEKLIAKKRDIKTSTMQQLLTGKTRLPGFGEGKGSKQSELGEIPDDWEVASLRQKFAFKQGFQCPVEDQYENNFIGRVRFIRIVDLTQPETPYRYISDPGVEQHIKKTDLFMVRYGAPGVVGHGFCGVVANNLFRITSKDEIDSKFFYYLLKDKEKDVLQLSSSTTMAAVNFESLGCLGICFPSMLTEQQAIAAVFSDMDKELESLQTRLNKTKSIKQGMMQELLTGKTRLLEEA